ncbi:Uncharacterised protein [Legionella busanensis]|uniref:Uncharacterized protein n=1 Tax=Legionella busanensis TaxID=190655 RepID=A0A378JMM8_9GAMM|nr:hypothetical protein [Legionella busanensis]STX51563.1 Uncharacterised protein [Legionella busanensis]
MGLHIIEGLPVCIHELQIVLLISTPTDKPISKEIVQSIVNKVVLDRDNHENLGKRSESTYQIQEPALGFDVFVRQAETLVLYSFKETGEFISDAPARTLNEAGLFHFQFTIPKEPIVEFNIGEEEFKINCVTAENFASLSIEKRNKMLDEIASFNKTHFPEHFNLWELNDKSSEIVRDHFYHLQQSCNSLYIIRDSQNKIVATSGISATSDGQLTFQSMSITRTTDRKKGIMAVNLSRATFDYPNAVMTAYFVNSDIRQSLGSSAMTSPNTAHQLSTERNSYLEMKMSGITMSKKKNNELSPIYRSSLFVSSNPHISEEEPESLRNDLK